MEHLNQSVIERFRLALQYMANEGIKTGPAQTAIRFRLLEPLPDEDEEQEEGRRRYQAYSTLLGAIDRLGPAHLSIRREVLRAKLSDRYGTDVRLIAALALCPIASSDERERLNTLIDQWSAGFNWVEVGQLLVDLRWHVATAEVH